MNPLVALAGLVGASTSNIPTTLTMDQAVQIAQERAFSVLLQESAVEKQRQAMYQSAAGLGPKLTFNGTYTRFDQSAKASFGGNSFTVSPIDTKQLQAIAALPIDITGNLHRLVYASEKGLAAQRETLLATESNIALTVKTDYLTILRAKAQVAVAQDSVTSNQELVKTTQAQVKQGVDAKIDLLRAEAQLAQAQGTLLTAQNTLTLAKETLNDDLARPIETPFHVLDVTKPPVLDLSVSDLTGIAAKDRPELKAMNLTLAQLAAITKATEQSNLPSLNLSVTATQNIGAVGFGGRLQTATAAATLSWPIFDSGLTRAEVKQARQNQAQAQIQLNQEKLGISLELQQAVSNYQNAQSRYQVAASQVEEAQEALRLAMLNLQQGEGVYLDVLNAETTLTTAKSGLVTAQYDLWQAIASLQHAIGTDSLPTMAPAQRIKIVQ